MLTFLLAITLLGTYPYVALHCPCQYNVKPEFYGAFIGLTNEKLHLRMAHSQLIGYWTTELGGLNQVVDGDGDGTTARRSWSLNLGGRTWI